MEIITKQQFMEFTPEQRRDTLKKLGSTFSYSNMARRHRRSRTLISFAIWEKKKVFRSGKNPLLLNIAKKVEDFTMRGGK